MTKEEFYSRALSFDEVGEQVDIFKKEKIKYEQEIERLNKEIETLKQPQIFIDTHDMEERYAQGIYEDFIEEEYEKLIFDYLTNNCKEFDDEHIKKMVDLKVEQHLSSQKEIERLNKENKELKEEKELYQAIVESWER